MYSPETVSCLHGFNKYYKTTGKQKKQIKERKEIIGLGKKWLRIVN